MYFKDAKRSSEGISARDWWAANPIVLGSIKEEIWVLRVLAEHDNKGKLGKWQFWFLFIGFQVTFLCQHWLGVQGMPRRYGDYLASDDFGLLNHISTMGSGILGISTILFLINVIWTWRKAPMVGVDDPWGYGGSLEWATSCPPPRHNFTSIPTIRSERPAFDLHHPEYALNPVPESHATATAVADRPAAEATTDGETTEGTKQ